MKLIGIKRCSAAALAITAGFVGIWASAAPLSFYTSFPGGGRHWVSMLGPYDEHLVRDVGGLYLAFLVITSWAVMRPRPESLALVGTGWLTFGIPHLIFHLNHLGGMSTADQIANVANLLGTVTLGAALLFPTSRSASGRETTIQRQARGEIA